MKTLKLLFPVLGLGALLAMMPQAPQDPAEPAAANASTVLQVSELQYVDPQGKTSVVPSRNVLEVRLLDDVAPGLRFEILYDNGDYSLIEAQALHILRSGRDRMDVRFIRSPRASLRFPKLP